MLDLKKQDRQESCYILRLAWVTGCAGAIVVGFSLNDVTRGVFSSTISQFLDLLRQEQTCRLPNPLWSGRVTWSWHQVPRVVDLATTSLRAEPPQDVVERFMRKDKKRWSFGQLQWNFVREMSRVRQQHTDPVPSTSPGRWLFVDQTVKAICTNLVCTCLYMKVTKASGLFSMKTGSQQQSGLGTSWDILGHLGTSWDILGHLGTSWDILGHLGTSWDNLGHCGWTQVVRSSRFGISATWTSWPRRCSPKSPCWHQACRGCWKAETSGRRVWKRGTINPNQPHNIANKLRN